MSFVLPGKGFSEQKYVSVGESQQEGKHTRQNSRKEMSGHFTVGTQTQLCNYMCISNFLKVGC